MSNSLEKLTPAPDTPYGQLLQQAKSDGEAALITLSAGFQNARDTIARRQPPHATADFLRQAIAISESLVEPAQQAYEITHNDAAAGPVLQSRAAMYAVFNKSMALMPALFRFDTNDVLAERARSMAVDKNTYGTIGELAYTGLKSMGDDIPEEHQQALGEITTVALGTRGKNRNRIILPALHKEVQEGINLDCFNYVASLHTGGHTPMHYSTHWSMWSPPQAAHISAEDIGCTPKAEPWGASYPFATIEALELEADGFRGRVLGNYGTKVYAGIAEVQATLFRTAIDKIVAY